MNVGAIIKELRTEKGMTQNQLAKVLEITQDSISLWENGKRLPDVQYIVKLSDFFQVSIDYLLGRSDDLGAVPIQSGAPALSAEDAEILRLFHSLSDSTRRMLLGVIRSTVEAEKDSTEKRA